MKLIIIIVLIIFVGCVGYLIYQIFRIEKIYQIRMAWINTDDNRWHKHTYDNMFIPSKNNWYGLKWPKDKHFK